MNRNEKFLGYKTNWGALYKRPPAGITLSDEKIPVDVNNDFLADYYTPDIVSAQDYYPFGMLMPERQYNTSKYTYSFNGKLRDDNVYGKGNFYNYGFRMYDSRLGRFMSVDPLFKKYPSWSPYKYGLDNPITFIDLTGETEFYFNGKWVGTDGVDNNLVAKVESRKVKRQIKKSTRHGLNYEAQSINKAAGFKNGMLLINKAVLKKSYNILTKQLTGKGKIGEYSAVMIKDGDNHFKTTFEKYQVGDGVDGLPSGDVSIHGHSTGINNKGEIVRANQPSTREEFGNNSDEASFENFNINIIVGNNGGFVKFYSTQNDGSIHLDKVEDNRYPAINIYDSNTDRVGTLTGKKANKMLSGDRGRLGKKFNRKRAKDSK